MSERMERRLRALEARRPAGGGRRGPFVIERVIIDTDRQVLSVLRRSPDGHYSPTPEFLDASTRAHEEAPR